MVFGKAVSQQGLIRISPYLPARFSLLPPVGDGGGIKEDQFQLLVEEIFVLLIVLLLYLILVLDEEV